MVLAFFSNEPPNVRSQAEHFVDVNQQTPNKRFDLERNALVEHAHLALKFVECSYREKLSAANGAF